MAEWKVSPTAPPEYLAALRDLHPLIAQILYARGLTDAEAAYRFISGTPDPVDPFALADMGRAVARILTAIGRDEPIAVYADYDCDGITAGALLMRTLASLGARAQIYIPDRFEEGYGLNIHALDKLKAQGIGLVVTVDCGARAHREAQHARSLGLDLIVTDHHELEAGKLPDAFAVINPKRPDCPYQFAHLAGVGVAFRLAQCLLRTARAAGSPANGVTEASLLDLVALGTVADVVPLIGENRALVRAGLERLNRAPRLGLQHLIQVAGLRLGALDAMRIGFALAPRLNAAGRLENARAAYDLLMCEDPDQAAELAARLDRKNSERQQVMAAIAADAERRAIAQHSPDDGDLPAILFAASPDYNIGVVGLAAARLAEKFHRPAVVVGICGDEARGSCRSIAGFDIIAALDHCRDLLLKHGGHAAAAGFTTHANALDALQARLRAIAAAEQPKGGWQRVLWADAEVALDQIDARAIADLQRLEPHGQGNPPPTLVVRAATVTSVRRVGRADGQGDQPHLQLRLTDARRVTWDAIAWRMGERASELAEGATISLVCRLNTGARNGQPHLELEVLDFRTSS
jgi:single-stranded-DNA-specific exonuclease